MLSREHILTSGQSGHWACNRRWGVVQTGVRHVPQAPLPAQYDYEVVLQR